MRNEKPQLGQFVWRDLTVADPQPLLDFYADVVGWKMRPHAMGDYDDYDVVPAGSDDPISGICHARGINANIPAVWLNYVTVADVAASAARCVELGGKVLDGPRPMGAQQFCVIQDPAGAILGLIEATVSAST